MRAINFRIYKKVQAYVYITMQVIYKKLIIHTQHIYIRTIDRIYFPFILIHTSLSLYSFIEYFQMHIKTFS